MRVAYLSLLSINNFERPILWSPRL
jgi:hypothetical protein